MDSTLIEGIAKGEYTHGDVFAVLDQMRVIEMAEFMEEIKKLVEFRDTYVGLYVTKTPEDINSNDRELLFKIEY